MPRPEKDEFTLVSIRRGRAASFRIAYSSGSRQRKHGGTCAKAEPPPMPPSEYRVRAKRLLKRADFQETVAEAATRFQRLESFSGMAVSQVIECREGVKLKHALAVVALKQGYGSWDARSCPR